MWNFVQKNAKMIFHSVISRPRFYIAEILQHGLQTAKHWLIMISHDGFCAQGGLNLSTAQHLYNCHIMSCHPAHPGDITWANSRASAFLISWRKGTFSNHGHGSMWTPWYGCFFGVFLYKKGLFSCTLKYRIFCRALQWHCPKFRRCAPYHYLQYYVFWDINQQKFKKFLRFAQFLLL